MTKVAGGAGVTLMHGEPILYLEPAEVDGHHVTEEAAIDLDHIRPDLAELIARKAITLDENRPASVERRAQDQPAHRAREHRAAGR